LRHDNFVPDIALIDPELTITCPPEVTASSGMDCFTQLTEAYLSDRSNEYTDALAWEGLKAIKSSLTKSYEDGNNEGARSGMSFAALTSGICLANAGLGVVHGFASSVGGLFQIPHGVVCGSLMAKSNFVTVRALRKKGDNFNALLKYSRLGRLFLEEKNRSDDFYIDGFLDYLKKISYDLNLPALKHYGISKNDLERICSITEMKNNPVRLDLEDLIEIMADQI
jgi:alcohol dehydrogenase class IV